MSRKLFYFSLLSLTLTACSTADNKRAAGDFDYAEKKESKELVIPASLDKPAVQSDFVIINKNNINTDGPIGQKMDIRAPSLVLPVAASSRIESETQDAMIWFDKVLEDKELITFIRNSIISQLMSDDVTYDEIKSNIDEQGSQNLLLESSWYHSEVETGWLFTEIELSTSLKFSYELVAKPHGRSVSLKVMLIDYMKTDSEGGSKKVDPIDKQRAEMAMLNEIVAQVDYDYRLHQRENRLMRANQQLVTIGENAEAEPAYIVEMSLDNLWSNMPFFFEKHGFTITDLNETNKIYYVDFTKPETSIWDAIWGDERPIIEVEDAKYQFVLGQVDDKGQKTSVTIYNVDGENIPLETLETIFPVMEKGLSFRSFY